MTTNDERSISLVVGRSSLVSRRMLLRLLRRRPLQVMSAAVMALAVVAITAASAAGLKLVEPHAQAYPVSLLSALAANYMPWRDANPRGRRIDPAIIADAARDEAARKVTPAPGDSSLVPLELPPLPQAAVPAGRPLAAREASPALSPTTAIANTASPSGATTTGPAVLATSRVLDGERSSPTVQLTKPTTEPPTVSQPTPELAATDPPPQAPSEVDATPELEQPSETAAPPPTYAPPVTEPPVVTAAPPPATAASAPSPTRSSAPRPTRVPPTPVPPTLVPPPTATLVPPTPVPPTPVPPSTATLVPPTPVPPTPVPPPTATPVPPTATPVPPTDTPVPPTDTPAPVPLFVQIVDPSDGATVSGPGQTKFQAIAYDPAVSTTDGAGITSVDFSIVLLSGSGSYSYTSTENAAAYCVYGGNGPCSNIPNWVSMGSGTYRLTATANAPGKPSVSVSVTFTKP